MGNLNTRTDLEGSVPSVDIRVLNDGDFIGSAAARLGLPVSRRSRRIRGTRLRFRTSSSSTTEEDYVDPSANTSQLITRGRRRLFCGKAEQDEDCFCDLPSSGTSHLQASDISHEVMLSSGRKRFCKQGTECCSRNSAILLHHRQLVGSPTTGGFSASDRAAVTSHYLPNCVEPVATFRHRVFGGVFSQNGSVFMSSCQDQHIRLYDTENGKFCCFKDIKAREVGWTVVDVSYSPDQNYLIYSSWCDCSEAVVIDLKRILHLCSVLKDSETHIPLDLRPDGMYSFCPFSIRFSQDNTEILAGANDGCLYIYDRQRDDRILRVLGHDDHVNSVAFADDSSNILITAGDDGIVSVWDRRTLSDLYPQPVGQFAGHGAGLVFIDPKGDGRHLITNSKDQSIKLWDIRCFSSNSAVTLAKELVSAEHAQWDYRWQPAPKKFRSDWKMKGDSSLMTYRGHCVNKCQIRCRFSPAHTTGQQYIYSGCAAGNLIFYDLLTGEVVSKMRHHEDPVRDVSWHPFENTLCTTSWDGTVGRWQYCGQDSCVDY